MHAAAAICVTTGAGMRQRTALRPVHQASKTIKTSLRIMRLFVPAHTQGIKPLRLTQSQSYYFPCRHWTAIEFCCVYLLRKCRCTVINHEASAAAVRGWPGSPLKTALFCKLRSRTSLVRTGASLCSHFGIKTCSLSVNHIILFSTATQSSDVKYVQVCLDMPANYILAFWG